MKKVLYLPPGKAVEGGEEEDYHMDGQYPQGEEETLVRVHPIALRDLGQVQVGEDQVASPVAAVLNQNRGDHGATEKGGDSDPDRYGRAAHEGGDHKSQGRHGDHGDSV